MLLFALRHGERADRAPCQRFNLLKFDPCLTEKGLIQAEQSMQKILSMVPSEQSIHLVSSPFLRCLETASFIAKAKNIPIHVEEGFGEILLSEDFDFSPMDKITLYTKEKFLLENELGVQLIENNHIARAEYPESYKVGKERIKKVWHQYFPQRKEDVLIVVSHLFVIEALSEVWLGQEYLIDETGYCRLSVCRYDGNYQMIQLADFSHAEQ